jgi:hypothetical protein
MALTALATIKGGIKPGTQERRETLPAGESVPKGYFTSDELKHYKEIGVIGEPSSVAQAEGQAAEELAAKDAEIAELKKKLAEAETSASSSKGSSSSSGSSTSSKTSSGGGQS